MPTKIAFASCSRIESFPDQPVWADVAAEDPDYLFLLGDQIYMDYGIFGNEPNGSPKGLSTAQFAKKMAAKYAKQFKEPHFAALLDQLNAKGGDVPRVHATWDDHDFAWNDARGASCLDPVSEEKKAASLELFLSRFGQPGQRTVYKTFDLKLARVIFLDNRMYAQEPGRKASLLGEEQWAFLESTLPVKEHGKPYTLLCGGITLTHGLERWQNYRREYKRLSALIRDKGKGVLFLAGDIHYNEISRPGPKRPCYELVSSGIAVNYAGLPGQLDDCHNWGMLTLAKDEVEVLFKHDILGRRNERETRKIPRKEL